MKQCHKYDQPQAMQNTKQEDHSLTKVSQTTNDNVNPLKPSFVIWLHFECSAPQRPNLPF